MNIRIYNFLIIPIACAFMVFIFDYINSGQEPFNCMYNILLLLYGVVIGWVIHYAKTNS